MADAEGGSGCCTYRVVEAGHTMPYLTPSAGASVQECSFEVSGRQREWAALTCVQKFVQFDDVFAQKTRYKVGPKNTEKRPKKVRGLSFDLSSSRAVLLGRNFAGYLTLVPIGCTGLHFAAEAVGSASRAAYRS